MHDQAAFVYVIATGHHRGLSKLAPGRHQDEWAVWQEDRLGMSGTSTDQTARLSLFQRLAQKLSHTPVHDERA